MRFSPYTIEENEVIVIGSEGIFLITEVPDLKGLARYSNETYFGEEDGEEHIFRVGRIVNVTKTEGSYIAVFELVQAD